MRSGSSSAMLASVPMLATILVVLATGYAIGSIPIANMVARRRGLADLRTVGDRNPGFWNAMDLLGVRAATPVLLGDTAKGAFAAGIAALLAGGGEWWLAYVGGGAAMVGHAWPILARFRGGRSVLTFVGTAIVVSPIAAALALALTVVVWAGTRRFEWAARAGIVAYPLSQLAIDGSGRTAATGALMTLIGVRFAQAARAERIRVRSDAPATPGAAGSR